MSLTGAAVATEVAEYENAWESSDLDREFSLSTQEFNDIRQLIKHLTGINMGESKRQLIYRRLSGRLRASLKQIIGAEGEGDNANHNANGIFRQVVKTGSADGDAGYRAGQHKAQILPVPVAAKTPQSNGIHNNQ